MIRTAPARTRRVPARCYWHPFFVILPRTLSFKDEYGGFNRARVFWRPMMRRWSQAYKRWFWALPGTVEEGSRP